MFEILFRSVTALNAKKPHPAGPENTAIPQFEIKNPEIPQQKWSNTAIPQTPMSPSCNVDCRLHNHAEIHLSYKIMDSKSISWLSCHGRSELLQNH